MTYQSATYEDFAMKVSNTTPIDRRVLMAHAVRGG